MQFPEKEFTLVSQHLVMTEHLNPNHHIFGGQLLAWLDKDIYIHVSNVLKYKTFVTLAMNHVRFRNPAYLGEVIQIYAKIEELKRTSVTAIGKAVAYDQETGNSRDIIECQVTFVALDENGKPRKIPR